MTPSTERRQDLDWLRTFAILLLVVFHAAMPFNADWEWHVVNDQRSRLLLEWSFFLSRWRMAILTLIAGVGTAYGLRRRTGPEYLRARSHRLLVPLLFGMVVLVPPMVLVQRTREQIFYPDVATFARSFFDGRTYPDGNLSWHHLWFIAYLFTYSVLALPLFLWLRTERGRRWHAALADRLSGPWLFALALPLAWAYAGLIEWHHGPQNIVNDWAMYLLYFCIFVYGYLFAEFEGIWQALQRQRQVALGLALLSLLFVNILRWNRIEPPPGPFPQTQAYLALTGATPWLWTMAIAGYAHRYLNRAHPLLRYTNEAAYPIYVLHQPVLIGLAAFVLPLRESIEMKFVFLAFWTLFGTVAIYHLLVRPFRPMRYLLGMSR